MRDAGNCSAGDTLSTDTNTSHDKGPNGSGENTGKGMRRTKRRGPRRRILQWRNTIGTKGQHSLEAPCQANSSSVRLLCVAAATAAAGASMYVNLTS